MEAIPKEKTNKPDHNIIAKDSIEHKRISEIMVETFKVIVKDLWDNNVPEAKYKIGEVVFFKHNLLCGYGKIIGINNTGDGIEYCLEDIPFLLWEEQIEEDERPEYEE